MTNLKSFNLSDQALGAVMMALQRSLMDQSDIVPVLQGMDFVPTAEGLVVKNPPLVKFKTDDMTLEDEESGEHDSLVDDAAAD